MSLNLEETVLRQANRHWHKKGWSEKQLSHQLNGPQSPLWPRFCRDHPPPPKITSQPTLPTEPTFLHLSKYVRRPFCSRLYLLRANNWSPTNLSISWDLGLFLRNLCNYEILYAYYPWRLSMCKRWNIGISKDDFVLMLHSSRRVGTFLRSWQTWDLRSISVLEKSILILSGRRDGITFRSWREPYVNVNDIYVYVYVTHKMTINISIRKIHLDVTQPQGWHHF